MSNVVAFPRVNNAYAAGRSAPHGLSQDDLRQLAWSNHYSAERRAGSCADLAHSRADAFVARHFDGLIAEIAVTMEDRA